MSHDLFILLPFLTLISDLMEEKQHHVKTGETTLAQTESISLLKRRDKKGFTALSVDRVSHSKKVSRDT